MSELDPASLRLAAPGVQVSERLRLRELTHADDAFIMELVNDPLWLRFIGERNVHSLEEARGYIDRIRDNSYAKHGFGLWAVERPGAGEVTGICGLLKRVHLDVPDIGFAFLDRHRGQGLASEALAATLGLAHERFGLRQVAAVTDLDNLASQRVLERARFRFEQIVRWAESDDNVRLYRRTLP